MSHTPGLWRVDEKGSQPGIDSPDQSIVLAGDRNNDQGILGATRDEMQANARLIAAAPELLEALTALLSDIEGLVANSEGVAGLHLNGDLAPWSDICEGGRHEWITSLDQARAVITKATQP